VNRREGYGERGKFAFSIHFIPQSHDFRDKFGNTFGGQASHQQLFGNVGANFLAPEEQIRLGL